MPVVDIVRVAGLLSIPLVFLSLLGFLKILGFRFFEWKTQILVLDRWALGNVHCHHSVHAGLAAYYIVMMIAGAAISLAGALCLRRLAKRQSVPERSRRDATGRCVRRSRRSFQGICAAASGRVDRRAYESPGDCGMARSLSIPRRCLGIRAIRVNIFTSAGFFIFVTALVCYSFPLQARPTPAKDFVTATQAKPRAFTTLLVGSATVYLMVDTGQIALLGKVLSERREDSSMRRSIRAWHFSGAWPSDRACRQIFCFRGCRLRIAPMLGIPLMVLVGIVTVITMGPPNALKPTQIAYHRFARKRERDATAKFSASACRGKCCSLS